MTAQRGDFGRLPVNAGDVRERLALIDALSRADETMNIGLPPEELADALLPTVDALIREGAAEALARHDLMARQFRVMQREKEHGWSEAERWEVRALAAEEQLAALRAASKHTEATR